jgi:predicted GIY-YIG superfamily endonuclease
MNGAYILTDRKSGVFYIGSSNDFFTRLSRHMGELAEGIHHATLLQEAFNAGAQISHSFQGVPTREDAYKLERMLIEQHAGNKLLANKTYNGYSPVITEETKRKLSILNKGKKHTPEVVAKMTEFQRGRVRTPEQIAQLVNSIPRTPVSINGVKFDSATDASRHFNIGLSTVRQRVHSKSEQFKDWILL